MPLHLYCHCLCTASTIGNACRMVANHAWSVTRPLLNPRREVRVGAFCLCLKQQLHHAWCCSPALMQGRVWAQKGLAASLAEDKVQHDQHKPHKPHQRTTLTAPMRSPAAQTHQGPALRRQTHCLDAAARSCKQSSPGRRCCHWQADQRPHKPCGLLPLHTCTPSLAPRLPASPVNCTAGGLRHQYTHDRQVCCPLPQAVANGLTAILCPLCTQHQMNPLP